MTCLDRIYKNLEKISPMPIKTKDAKETTPDDTEQRIPDDFKETTLHSGDAKSELKRIPPYINSCAFILQNVRYFFVIYCHDQ